MKRFILLAVMLPLLGCSQSGDVLGDKQQSKGDKGATSSSPKTKGTIRAEMEAPDVGDAKDAPPEDPPPIPDSLKLLHKDKKNLFFEKTEDGGRRVHLLAEVCLREGPLEVFLCKQQTKEHEAVLRADVDGRDVHLALVAANAKPGSPVKFVPKYTPASGTKIKVSLTYRVKGKVVTVPAGEWVKDIKAKRTMAHDWVFGGSRLFKDPERPNAPPYYMANNGELISISNFPDSMLDLPVQSSKDAAELQFEANTSKIPPLGTPVLVTLEPAVEKNENEKK